MSNNRTKQTASDWKHQIRESMIPAAVVGGILSMGVAVALFSSGTARVSEPIHGPATALHEESEDPMWPLIKEIADAFLCGCGKCGDMSLVECVCEDPAGGVAEKRFIRSRLVEGLSKDEIIDQVDARFGRKKA